MLVSPTIRNLKVTKMLVDSGAGLNLISSAVLRKLQIPDGELEETGSFQGVNPGRSKPKGKITLPVTFGGELNYRTEKVTFDVADIPLPYNGILGRPALAKFMAASHHAYNVLKMPGPITVITVPCDKKDALICADKIYREAAAAAAAKSLAAEAPGGKNKKKSGKKRTARGGRRSKAKQQQKDRPPRGRDKDEADDDDDLDDDESSEHEFQKATEVLCVDGGASLHSSHYQLKQWA
jgi:hypothetical protein